MLSLPAAVSIYMPLLEETGTRPVAVKRLSGRFEGSSQGQQPGLT
jgi:hypothetical protein